VGRIVRNHDAATQDGTGPLSNGCDQPLSRCERARGPLDAFAALGLLTPLDRHGPDTLELQLESRIARAVHAGRLRGGVRLPSSRSVASSLGISRNVVAAVYAELAGRGVLIARHGSGTFVDDGISHPTRRPVPAPETRWLATLTPGAGGDPPKGYIDLSPRGGSLAPLPRAAWRRAWRVATADLPSAYEDPRGARVLRRAIANYVARHRGVPASEDEVLVTSGASDALALILRAVVARGTPFAFEQPGYQTVRRLAEARGAQPVTLDGDGDGAIVEALAAANAVPVAVHVTPAHHFPLAAELSPARRRWLLAWAKAEGALVIENDYSGEFGFTTTTPPPLAALDRSGSVAFVGTFSRLLSPSLRVGYVIASEALIGPLSRLKRDLDDYPSTPAQLAVAQLIDDGELDRHLRRIRRLAEYKRGLIARYIGEVPQHLRLTGLDSGLHVVLQVRSGLTALELAAAAKSRGVLLDTLASYGGAVDTDRLLLDYGSVDAGQLETALSVITEIAVTGELVSAR
jgi:GntR family transcriptional regulator / MocR family aminotransferase